MYYYNWFHSQRVIAKCNYYSAGHAYKLCHTRDLKKYILFICESISFLVPLYKKNGFCFYICLVCLSNDVDLYYRSSVVFTVL